MDDFCVRVTKKDCGLKYLLELNDNIIQGLQIQEDKSCDGC